MQLSFIFSKTSLPSLFPLHNIWFESFLIVSSLHIYVPNHARFTSVVRSKRFQCGFFSITTDMRLEGISQPHPNSPLPFLFDFIIKENCVYFCIEGNSFMKFRVSDRFHIIASPGDRKVSIIGLREYYIFDVTSSSDDRVGTKWNSILLPS